MHIIQDRQGIRPLRIGVQRAIESLGTGFLAHPDNRALRAALTAEYPDQRLEQQEYYRQLLRLVYRIIYLFMAVDRGHGIRRLHELARKRWDGVERLLWAELRLDLDPLDDACPWLGDAACSDEHLLDAIRQLSHLGEDGSVDWHEVGAGQLGCVYENLLERHPVMEVREAWAPSFRLDTAAGNERKTTGSYYTPAALVDRLLDSALEPVLAEACAQPDPEAALLDLKVCDPACGSGHFLVAAARRMATRLVSVRGRDNRPGPPDFERALRDIIGRCIHGVDINPMAVELCKLGLWLESGQPGRPLAFLDNHILCGNALIGATPALMDQGIPDPAFQPIDGDDKQVAAALRRRNRAQRRTGTHSPANAVAAPSSPDSSARELDTEAAEAAEAAELCAHAFCAAFLWPKHAGHQGRELAGAAVTHDTFQRLRARAGGVSRLTRETVRALARDYRFLHWHLAFPQVFAGSGRLNPATGWRGGFDVILGNPPWDRVKLQEKEFFAVRSPTIAGAANAAARKRLIHALPEADPELWRAWVRASRSVMGYSHILRQSGLYPLCGRGDVNTYAVFAELGRRLLAPAGRAGFIVPSGIATDATTQYFFRDLMETGDLQSLYDFQSGPGLFSEVGHARFKFCLVTLGQERGARRPGAEFAFCSRDVAHLDEHARRFRLDAGDIELLNPNTRTCPIFRTRRDAELSKAIYRRVPVLWREHGQDSGNPWGVRFSRMFDMANDSSLFRTRADLLADQWQPQGNAFSKQGARMLPLYEAKMVHHYDHRFGDYADKPPASRSTALPEVSTERLRDPAYAIAPRYWVAESEVASRLGDAWPHGWLLGWRDICRAGDARTVIASVIPRVAVGHKLPIVFSTHEPAAFYAGLTSFVFDYCARQKIGGTSLALFVLKQLPMPGPAGYALPCPWHAQQTLAQWLRPRVLELTYTAWDLAPFAGDLGHHGPPFAWNPARRSLLRAELDAAFFHLYGVARDDVDYIMDSFWIVRDKDLRVHRRYRTKEQILECYDRMQRAMDTGLPYPR